MTKKLTADPSLGLRMTESFCRSEQREESAFLLQKTAVDPSLGLRMSEVLTADPSLPLRMTRI
jgi:hypothetical protein